jgi:hypothetical protein
MHGTPEIRVELPLAGEAAAIAEVVASPQKDEPGMDFRDGRETSGSIPPEEVISPDPLPTETSQEPAPVIDIHPPHHGGITRRDFFVHLFTVVLGILIAIGLEQGVEYIHHRRELAEARKELATERKIDIVRFSVETEDIHRYVPVLENNLAIFVYLRQHPGQAVPPSLGTLRWNMMSITMLNSAWTTAQHNGVIDYMRPSEARNDAQLYTRLDMLTQQIRDARAAAIECMRYRVIDPDPTHLSPDQLDHQIDLVSRALLVFRNLANSMRNANSQFPDLAPAPSAQDLAAIFHVAPTRSADDQRDWEAVNRELATFQDYEKSLDQNEGPE